MIFRLFHKAPLCCFHRDQGCACLSFATTDSRRTSNDPSHIGLTPVSEPESRSATVNFRIQVPPSGNNNKFMRREARRKAT